MKRDMDLIREILIQIADHEAGRPKSWQVHIESRDPFEVAEHLDLCVKRGLVEGVKVSSHASRGYLDPKLTWDGHDFVEAARDDTRWMRAKQLVLMQGGALVMESLKLALAELAKGMLP